MSCPIAHNPQILPSPQPIQKPQNSSDSKYAVGFAAGTVVTGTLIGSALAINSYMTQTPSLFSNYVNAETLKSILKTVGTPVVGGLGGALISGGTSLYVLQQICPVSEDNMAACGVVLVAKYAITLFTAAAGAATGAVALTAARILPV